ncbi:chaperone protein ClpB1-like [Triticum dicoccoides]|uniref:chaperone protein ClpB1-like n=1 Tax=Triticum dicoccoides TaxID=85692 RepID=UPI001890CFDE|nr:chaperone protein ClpB1-like [Triticum dicoccoides]
MSSASRWTFAPPSHQPTSSLSAQWNNSSDITKAVILSGATATVTLAAMILCDVAWTKYDRRRRRKASLSTFGRDMTATAGKSDPVVGRDDEIDRVVRILCRRTKNCAALVGAPGVGKTAIAEGLAQRVAAGKVPAPLLGARVVELDVAGMVSGTVWRGMFEERMKDVIQQKEDSGGKVILFIDEMHMLIEAGDWQDRHDTANMLKPALARGRIGCVGATTLDEYSKHVEKDPALERRFQKVHVDEQATIGILRGLKKGFEEHHEIKIQDAAIVAAAQLAGRYVTGRIVHEYFKPELLNRLSQIVIFDPVSHEQLMEVVKMQMKSATTRVANKGISLSVSDAALDVILSQSYNPMYGARPIRSWVQNNVMPVISEILVKKKASKGSRILIDAADNKKGLKYDVVKEEVVDAHG